MEDDEDFIKRRQITKIYNEKFQSALVQQHHQDYLEHLYEQLNQWKIEANDKIKQFIQDKIEEVEQFYDQYCQDIGQKYDDVKQQLNTKKSSVNIDDQIENFKIYCQSNTIENCLRLQMESFSRDQLNENIQLEYGQYPDSSTKRIKESSDSTDEDNPIKSPDSITTKRSPVKPIDLTSAKETPVTPLDSTNEYSPIKRLDSTDSQERPIKSLKSTNEDNPLRPTDSTRMQESPIESSDSEDGDGPVKPIDTITMKSPIRSVDSTRSKERPIKPSESTDEDNPTRTVELTRKRESPVASADSTDEDSPVKPLDSTNMKETPIKTLDPINNTKRSSIRSAEAPLVKKRPIKPFKLTDEYSPIKPVDSTRVKESPVESADSADESSPVKPLDPTNNTKRSPIRPAEAPLVKKRPIKPFKLTNEYSPIRQVDETHVTESPVESADSADESSPVKPLDPTDSTKRSPIRSAEAPLVKKRPIKPFKLANEYSPIRQVDATHVEESPVESADSADESSPVKPLDPTYSTRRSPTRSTDLIRSKERPIRPVESTRTKESPVRSPESSRTKKRPIKQLALMNEDTPIRPMGPTRVKESPVEITESSDENSPVKPLDPTNSTKRSPIRSTDTIRTRERPVRSPESTNEVSPTRQKDSNRRKESPNKSLDSTNENSPVKVPDSITRKERPIRRLDLTDEDNLTKPLHPITTKRSLIRPVESTHTKESPTEPLELTNENSPIKPVDSTTTKRSPVRRLDSTQMKESSIEPSESPNNDNSSKPLDSTTMKRSPIKPSESAIEERTIEPLESIMKLNRASIHSIHSSSPGSLVPIDRISIQEFSNYDSIMKPESNSRREESFIPNYQRATRTKNDNTPKSLTRLYIGNYATLTPVLVGKDREVYNETEKITEYSIDSIPITDDRQDRSSNTTPDNEITLVRAYKVLIQEENDYQPLSSSSSSSSEHDDQDEIPNINEFNIRRFDQTNYSTIMFQKCQTEYNCLSSSTKRNELIVYNSKLKVLIILQYEYFQQCRNRFYLHWPSHLSANISDITYCHNIDQFLISTWDSTHIYLFNRDLLSLIDLGKLSDKSPLRRIHYYQRTIYCILSNNYLFECQLDEDYSQLTASRKIKLFNPDNLSRDTVYHLLDVTCDENYLIIIYSNEHDEIHLQCIYRQTNEFYLDLLLDIRQPINQSYIRIESMNTNGYFIYLNGSQQHLKTIDLVNYKKGKITSIMRRNTKPTNVCLLQDKRLVILYEQPYHLSVHNLITRQDVN